VPLKKFLDRYKGIRRLLKMKQQSNLAYEAINLIENKILQECREDPTLRSDPRWSPESATVTELAQVLARSYMNRTALYLCQGSIGAKADINALILEQHRWLVQRGYRCPEEIVTIPQLRVDYCAAGAIVRDAVVDNMDLYMGDLSMGVCHMIAKVFYGGEEALFEE
jgi:hypothetical protein